MSVPTNFQTTAPIFILIVVGYILLVLFLGAKRTFFEPWQGSPEDPENKSSAGKETSSREGSGDKPQEKTS
jgi:hypothetical protein